jgi:hypothetical protein
MQHVPGEASAMADTSFETTGSGPSGSKRCWYEITGRAKDGCTGSVVVIFGFSLSLAAESGWGEALIGQTVPSQRT